MDLIQVLVTAGLLVLIWLVPKLLPMAVLLLLFLAAYMGYKQKRIPSYMYSILFALSITILFYYIVMVRINVKLETDDSGISFNPQQSRTTRSQAARESLDAAPGREYTVTIKDYKFIPADLAIVAGDTVTWINEDQIGHTATSGIPEEPSGLFDSGILNNEETYSHTFENAGSFPYYCVPHPFMTGMIVVEPM